MEMSIKRKIYNLALPATIENVLQTLVGFIDTLMISKLGLMAVTGVGVANTVLNVYLAVFIALGVGTSSLIAQYIGAKKMEDAKRIASQSTVLALLVGGLFGVLTVLFGQPILHVMGASDEVMRYSTPFFFIVGGSSIVMALMTIFGSILRASGDTKSPMTISAIVNLLNIGIDYILIFGFGPIPALGIIGTAIGTVISRLLGSLLLYRIIQKSAIGFKFKTIFEESNYRSLIRLSIPATLERLVMRFGQVVYFGLIVGIGAKVFAAHSIAGNIESFVYMPAYGLATAATTLVGNSVGAKEFDEAKQVTYLTIKSGVILLSLLGGILFIGAPMFACLFTNDPEAIQQIVTALRIDAFNQPGLAISLIMVGALQGMGDTKSPLYSTAFGMWCLRIVGVILLGKQLGFGIAGIWVSIGIDLYLRSAFLIYRFKKNIGILSRSSD